MTPLITTTIGSLFRFSSDLNESIDKAIEFQRQFGIDLFSDGEQRADMISYFAESFAGLALENGVPVVTGKVALERAPEEFSKVQDLIHIRERFPDIKIKIAITGPTTLGMTCGSRRIKGGYSNLLDYALYEDIAIALVPIAKALSDHGAYVQIDEPFLSQGYRDLAARVKLLDVIARNLPRERVSIHVCGFIGAYGVLDHLLKLNNVTTLSFAFAGRTELPNIEHISRKAFEENHKKLGAGCISVTPMSEKDVGTAADVSSKLAEIAGRIGRENIAYAHPDCGLRVTNKSLVPLVVRNLRAGVDLFG